MSNSVQPHRRQPTRLPRPWDSPGKNTGVGCHSGRCQKQMLLSLSSFFTPSLLFTTFQGQRRDHLMCLGKFKVSSGRSAAQVNTRVSSLPARLGDRWAAVCSATPIPTPMKSWLCEFCSPGWLWKPAFTLVQAVGPRSTSQTRIADWCLNTHNTCVATWF